MCVFFFFFCPWLPPLQKRDTSSNIPWSRIKETLQRLCSNKAKKEYDRQSWPSLAKTRYTAEEETEWVTPINLGVAQVALTLNSVFLQRRGRDNVVVPRPRISNPVCCELIKMKLGAWFKHGILRASHWGIDLLSISFCANQRGIFYCYWILHGLSILTSIYINTARSIWPIILS